jgi:P-type Ca2+ transporter type 2C
MEKTNTTTISGLSVEEAAKRLKTDGYNELPSQKGQNIFVLIFNVIKEPMLLMLLGSGLLYLLLGEPKDAAMLLTFVLVVIGITFYEERKTERTLEALKNLSSPRALVVRDGKECRIPGREVVVGDIIVIQEGDRVPADARILQSSNILVDESLLTGESVPVRKNNWDGKEKRTQPGGEDLPFLFSGTLITQGHGFAEVVSTGVTTEMGKIGKSLTTIEEEDMLLKRETDKIVKNFTIIGIVLCCTVIILFSVSTGNWIEGFLAGLTLGMAMLPEEFGVVLIIFLTLGAWRISKRKVLTRKTPAIETLGAATVLCVDKTGTLTQNRMRLDGIMVDGKYLDITSLTKELPERYHLLLEYSFLASQKDPFDPMEQEIKRKFEAYLSQSEHVHDDATLIREYPLSKTLLALSHVWKSPGTKRHFIAAKGAPEAIADLCHLSPEAHKKLLKQITELSEKGLRVLGVAQAPFTNDVLPENQHDFQFQFLGLIGFTDPIRDTVPGAIAQCYKAGIRVIMITGDYPGTAKHIATKIGLQNPNDYITGPEIAEMDEQTLASKIRTINVCARVVPEQKLAIVNALKANGEIVAMTGDGVNDAPALKSAHIGIAMGERGTDVAREAADLVLLNDDFSSIVSAISLGRRIFDNLKKAIAFIVSVHIPIAGMSLFPVLFHLPVVLFPAHIAFLELIIDPSCTVVFESEKEERNTMNRPPRNLKQPLLSQTSLILSVLQGVSILAVVLLVFLLSLSRGLSELDARTLAFVTLVFSDLFLIVVNLSHIDTAIRVIKNKNIALFGVIIGTLTFLTLVLYVPFLRNTFHFSLLHVDDFLMAIGFSCISLIWFEGYKWIKRRSYFHSSIASASN